MMKRGRRCTLRKIYTLLGLQICVRARGRLGRVCVAVAMINFELLKITITQALSPSEEAKQTKNSAPT